jgi:replicative DNA helicase
MYDPALPPQNIEAEESILGGILLDPKAMGRIVDFLAANAFYVRSHQEIYRAAVSLHGKGKPTDVMTVSSWLQDYQLLDEVGGIPRLLQLIERTVSAANIDRYAELVMVDILAAVKRTAIPHHATFLGWSLNGVDASPKNA